MTISEIIALDTTLYGGFCASKVPTEEGYAEEEEETLSQDQGEKSGSQPTSS